MTKGSRGKGTKTNRILDNRLRQGFCLALDSCLSTLDSLADASRSPIERTCRLQILPS